MLVAIGTCAAWGVTPAMHNELSRDDLCRAVYGGDQEYFKTIPPQPLRALVKVDYAIPGCPREKADFLRAAPMLIHGDLPLQPTYAVRTECKMRENECLLVTRGQLCLGPPLRPGATHVARAMVWPAADAVAPGMRTTSPRRSRYCRTKGSPLWTSTMPCAPLPHLRRSWKRNYREESPDEHVDRHRPPVPH